MDDKQIRQTIEEYAFRVADLEADVLGMQDQLKHHAQVERECLQLREALTAVAIGYPDRDERSVCLWRVKQIGGNLWNTGCNAKYVFRSAGPVEAAWKFCPFCGDAIRT